MKNAKKWNLEEKKPPAGRESLADFQSFERSIIKNLDQAGLEGKCSADFMIRHQIHIGYGTTWYPNWFSAWWDTRGRKVMLHKRNFNVDDRNPDDPFLLNTIAHELDHLAITNQYGKSLIPAGLTKYGEIRGWKTGYMVQYHYTRKTPKPGSNIDQLFGLDLESQNAIDQGSSIIKNLLKNIPGGKVYSFFYSILPDYPRKYRKSPRQINKSRS